MPKSNAKNPSTLDHVPGTLPAIGERVSHVMDHTAQLAIKAEVLLATIVGPVPEEAGNNDVGIQPSGTLNQVAGNLVYTRSNLERIEDALGSIERALT